MTRPGGDDDEAPPTSRRGVAPVAHIPLVRPGRAAVDIREEEPPHVDERPSTKRRRGAETVRTMVTAAPLPADRATLTVVHGVDAGQVFVIEKDVAVLGRDGDVDFAIDDSAISRKHCRFRHTDDRFFVEDLESANGTFLGGRKLRPMQLGELFTGDRVQVGPNVILRFSLSDRLEEQMQRRLYDSATRDALTNTFNRSYLHERLKIEVASARRHRQDLSLIVLEVDKFQELSGTAGPTQAGRLLQAIAARLMRQLRIDDVLARIGGECFAVIARGTGITGAGVTAERLRLAIEEVSVTAGSDTLRSTISVGVCTLAELDAREGDVDFFDLGRARLAQAKREGGNRSCVGRPDVRVWRASR